jgi:hypothetical protein
MTTDNTKPATAAFACAKRAADPSNQLAACRQWCGDRGTCPGTALDRETVRRYVESLERMGDDDADDFASMGWTITPELLEAGRIVQECKAAKRAADARQAFAEIRTSREAAATAAQPPQTSLGLLDPNESDVIRLWAEIEALRAAVAGPAGYASWQEAATAERVRRVKAEKALELTAEALAAATAAPQPVGYMDAHKVEALRDAEGQDVIVITGVTSYRASKADVAIYTSPVQQPATLTDEQIDAIHFPGSTVGGVRQFARAVLAAATAAQPQPERAVFDRTMKETWQMVDPFSPPGAPGSYARGEHNGIVAALKTVRDNFDRLSGPAAGATGAQP